MLSALANIRVLSKSIDLTNGLGTLRLQVNLIIDSIFLATPMLGPCLSDDGIPLPPKAHGALRRQRRTPRWQQDHCGPPSMDRTSRRWSGYYAVSLSARHKPYRAAGLAQHFRECLDHIPDLFFHVPRPQQESY